MPRRSSAARAPRVRSACRHRASRAPAANQTSTSPLLLPTLARRAPQTRTPRNGARRTCPHASHVLRGPFALTVPAPFRASHSSPVAAEVTSSARGSSVTALTNTAWWGVLKGTCRHLTNVKSAHPLTIAPGACRLHALPPTSLCRVRATKAAVCRPCLWWW